MSEQKEIDYKRIYKSSGLFGRSAIFAAEDHFLIAVNISYTEEYNRFFYSDITALKVIIDKWANVKLAVAIILALVSLFVAIGAGSGAFQNFLGVIFAVSLIAVIYIVMKGPSVRLVFKTLTTERDFPMGRQHRLMKFLEKLRPYIEKAQGSFDSDELKKELLEDEKTYIL